MKLTFNGGINNTIKEKLFINPQPLSHTKDEFLFLHNRIFPDKEKFIDFLETSEEQQKKEIAKEILLRLCYESNFSPSYELLINVLNMEEKLSSDNYTNHVGRDHFVHLVNLYLLGIYLFFYNLDFNQKLYFAFRFTRQSSHNESLKLNAVKDYISSWKYFVLYHDLAYPFEFFGSSIDEGLNRINKDVLHEIKKNVFRFFNRESFKKLFIFELSVKSISKIFVVNREMKYLTNEFNNVFNHIEFKLNKKQLFKADDGKFVTVNKEQFSETFQINDIATVYKLQNIHTGESLKYMLSVYKRIDMLYVVTNILTGHLIAIVFPNKENNHTVLFTEQYRKDEKFANQLSNNPQMFFSDESFYDNICIDYYILDPVTKFDEYLASVATFENVKQRGITREKLDLALTTIMNNINDPAIISDVDFLDYAFKVYKKVRGILICKSEDYTYSFYSIQREVYKKFNSEVQDEFINACKDLIQNSLPDPESLDKDLTENIDNAILIDFIKDWTNKSIDAIISIPWHEQTKESEKNSIISRLIDSYSKDFECLLTINKIKDCIAEKIEGIFNNVDAHFYVDSVNEDGISISDKIIENFSENIINEINNKINNSFNTSDYEIEKLISHYMIGYSKYDHGVCGLKIYLQHLSFYRHYLEKCFDDDECINNGCLLPWHIDNNSDLIKTKYLDNYENLIPEIGFSLMMHNIYPQKFDEEKLRKYRTSMNKEPFAYYAIFSDSLQHWNRPYILNPALRTVSKALLSNFFNIDIQEKQIKVYVRGYNNNDSIEYINKLSLALEEYLSDVKHKVKVLIADK